MLKSDERYCDICGELILKDEKYVVDYMPPDAASLFLDLKELELTPTWTKMEDGKIRMDICLECKADMASLKEA